MFVKIVQWGVMRIITVIWKYYSIVSRFTYNCWIDLKYFWSQLHLWGSITNYSFRQSPVQSGSLTVLTYNVDFASVNHPDKVQKIVSAICEANADIVCLQETNSEWESILKKRIKYKHSFFHHDTNSRPAGGSAILSKFPIKTSYIIHSKIPGSVFPALFATLQVLSDDDNHTCSHPTLRLANIHLRPPLELNGTASLSTARTTRSIRTQELQYYKSLTNSSSCNCLDLLVGDFNEQDTYLNQMMIMKPNNCIWRNAVTEFIPTNKETHIWPFGYILSLKKRLDHIFYNTQTLVCNSCGVISGYEYGASDHQPIIGHFTFRNP